VHQLIADHVEGVARVHQLIADHVEEPSEVLIDIETDRGLFVQAPGPAIRSTRSIHCRCLVIGIGTARRGRSPIRGMPRCWPIWFVPTATITGPSWSTPILARRSGCWPGVHQSMFWSRQRQVNSHRSPLRELYPAALEALEDLVNTDALAVLAVAPTPARGNDLPRSKVASALRRGGRQRRVDERAEQIQPAFRAPHLQVPTVISAAMGVTVAAGAAVITETNARIGRLEGELSSCLSSTRTPGSSAPCQDSG
jgi:hypothetical protein